jgi:medium-chain acyl-[acyl-carrier-protein] hydrolase
MVSPYNYDRRWFKRFGRREGPADIRLLCFHHAGGSAAMYRHWIGLLPPSVEPIAVQLPGRADRFGEPAFDRMGPLVDELVDVLKPLLDRPFACYGISMGARVAWALSHALRERSMPMPSLLFVACAVAPVHDDGTWPWEGRADGLEGYMREMGGTPAEVLAEPELLQALLPTLRADLTVLSTHRFHPDTPLDIRIRGFAGTEDGTDPPDRMTAWQAETTARFDLDVVQSGHFLGVDAERQVVRTIGHDLVRTC